MQYSLVLYAAPRAICTKTLLYLPADWHDMHDNLDAITNR